ncbi:unnamed protein product [Notodromas monacha]|uniref:CDT1 Geminin-binding domain-containing protein n=1 Tax=Notodromas monacha TaxID=399045 RepID=A0A7R9BME3_9CRUS|nr:unnamed protein product [Notodromas monacha]CAG0916829.1 unnamed protein product [Notodromas monacha]
MKPKPSEETSPLQKIPCSVGGVDETRKKLSGCKSLKDLKARLTNLSNDTSPGSPSKRLQQALSGMQCVSGSSSPATKKSEIQEFGELLIPASPVKTSSCSPFKFASVRKNLRHDIPNPVSPTRLYDDREMRTTYDPFPLPHHMLELEERFKDFDYVLSVAHGRSRKPVPLCYLRDMIKSMKNWPVTHLILARFRTVYPDAFVATKIGEGKDDVTVLPVYDEDVSPSLLVKRVKVFRENLIEIAKLRHDVFLKSLKPQVMVCISEVRRWHPQYRYDTMIQVDPAADFPHLTEIPTEKPRVKRNLFQTTEEETNQDVSLLFNESLLEKIRKKETEAHRRFIMRSEEDAKRLRMMQRLPEIVRVLHPIFVAAKFKSLMVDDVLEKLKLNFPALFLKEVLMQHLELLSDETQEYKVDGAPAISLLGLRSNGNVKYLRFNSGMKVSEIQSLFEKRIAVLEKE